MEVAALGLKVDATGVEAAAKSLERISSQGREAEKALDGVSKTAPKAADEVAKVGKSATVTQAALRSIASAASGLDLVNTSSVSAAKGVGSLGISAKSAEQTIREMQAAMVASVSSIQTLAKAQEDAARSAATASQAFQNAGKQVSAYSVSAGKATQDSERVASSMTAASTAAGTLKTALAVAGVGLGTQELIGMVDGYTKYTAQLKLATRGEAEQAAAMASVNSIAARAQAGVGELATLYARVTNSTRELGISQQQVSNITESVALALKANGATASEASSAMLQLSQAFGSGVLRGEEFNAVYEAAPNLLQNLAGAMGAPVSQLRKMAEEGQLTSKVLAENLPKSLELYRTQAKEVETISGAFVVLKNNIMQMVGEQAKASGATSALTTGIGALANNLDVAATAVGVLGAVYATRLLVPVGATTAAFVAQQVAVVQAAAAISGASVTSTAAMAAMSAGARGLAAASSFLLGPWGAAIALVGTGVAAFYAFSDSSSKLVESIGGLNQPLDDLKKKIDALPPEKRISIILDIKEEAERKARESAKAYDDLASSVVGAFSGARSASAESAQQVNKLVDELNKAKDTGADMTPILVGAAKAASVSKSTLQTWLDLAANIREARRVAGNAAELRADAYVETPTDLLRKQEQGVSRGSRAGYEKEQEAVRQRALEITAKADGVTKDFISTLAVYDDQLKYRLISEDEYIKKVTALNEERYESTKAGKEEAKALKSSASAASAAQSEYAKLIASISAKLEQDKAELEYGRKLTDAEKLRHVLNAESVQGATKLTAADKASAMALLERADAAAKDLKIDQERRKAAEDFEKLRTKEADQAAETVAKIHERASAMEDEVANYGKSKDAIEETIIARLEERKAILEGFEGNAQALAEIEAEIEARQRLAAVMGEKAVLDADKKARENLQKSWDKTAQMVGDTLADYIMGGGKDAATYLKRLFSTLVLQPVVQTVVSGVMGTGVAGASGGVAGVLSGANTASSLYSSLSGGLTGTVAKGIGSVGSMLGSTMVSDFAAGMVGGAQMSAPVGMGIGSVGSAGMSTASSLGATFATALPWVAGIAAVASLIPSLLKGGTPHAGAGAIYGEGVLTGDKSTSNVSQQKNWSEATQSSVSALAASVGSMFDTMSEQFGSDLWYRVETGFAADNDDASRGLFAVTSSVGEILQEWGGKGGRYSSNAGKGWEQYVGEVAGSAFDVLKTIVPDWGDAILDAAQPSLDALEGSAKLEAVAQLAGQISNIRFQFDALGKSMPMFANATDNLIGTLLGGFGGVEGALTTVGSYYNNFYSEAERMENLSAQVQSALSGLNLGWLDPRSGEAAKEQFRATVETALATGQDELAKHLFSLGDSFALAADYAAKTAVAVEDVGLALQDAANSLSAAWSNLQSASGLASQYLGDTSGLQAQLGILRASVGGSTDITDRLAAVQQIAALEQSIWQADESNRQAAVQAAQAQEASLREQLASVQALATAARNLRSFVEDLRTGELSGLTESQRAAALAAQYSSQLARANTGDVEAFAELQRTTTDLLGLSSNTATTQAEYNLISARMAAELEATAAIQEASAVSAEQRLQEQLTVTQTALGVAQQQFKVSAETQRLINELLGSSMTAFALEQQNAVASLAAGTQTNVLLAGLPEGLGAVLSASLVPAINGLAAAQAAAAQAAQAQAAAAAEANRIAAGAFPQYAVGTPYVPETGLAMIHEGEMIVPRQYNPNAGAPVSRAIATADEDARLQNAALLTVMTRLLRKIDQWDADGLPHPREEYET